MQSERSADHGVLRSVGVAFLWLGLLSALFVGHQVWGTTWSASRGQHRLRAEYLALADRVEQLAAPTSTTGVTAEVPGEAITGTTVVVTAPPPVVTVPEVAVDPVLEAAVRSVVDARPGDVVARILAPSIGLDRYVVEGVGVEELRIGPGRYQGTSRLGGRGNSAIAGHRTTYGAPFERLDELRPGDRITVETPVGTAEYVVMEPQEAFAEWLGIVRSVGAGSVVVGPDDNAVLEATDDDRLTLTACTPKYSAKERIIVAARLVSEPFAILEPPPGITPSSAPTPATSVDPAPGGQDAGTAAPVDPASNPVVDPVVSPLAERARRLTTADPTLRQGFDGLSDEIAPTLLTGLLLLLCVILLSVIAGRSGRLVAAVVGGIPLLFVAWYFFEHLDRLLPAY